MVDATLVGEIERALLDVGDPPVLLVTGDGPDGVPLRQSLHRLAASAGTEFEPHATSSGDPAVIAYTSGTEAQPKGACYFSTDILTIADTFARHVIGVSDRDTTGGHLSLGFAFGLGSLLVSPLRFGAATVLADGFSAERLLSSIERHRITLLFGTATSYRLLLRIPEFERRFDLRSLRLCVSAGEPLDREVVLEWMRRTGRELIDSLGTTEMCHAFLSQRPGGVLPGATGLPVPGYEVRIVDDGLEELPSGTPGLLAVRGPTGCVYWRRPHAQRAYVREGWNVTGDIMIRDDRGYFWFQGRCDELIISAGYNISPLEVERVLLEHQAVAEAAVVASPDPIRGFVPKAFVVLENNATPDPAIILALQEHAQRGLAGYKCPRRYELLASLPRTLTGEIDRAALRAGESERQID